jgi:hypothetical protein
LQFEHHLQILKKFSNKDRWTKDIAAISTWHPSNIQFPQSRAFSVLIINKGKAWNLPAKISISMIAYSLHLSNSLLAPILIDFIVGNASRFPHRKAYKMP